MDKIDAETASNAADNDLDDGTEDVVDQVVSGVENSFPSSKIDSASIPSKSRPDLDFDVQEPFQPGSTPIHLQSRFMVWNAVGIVKSFTSDEEKSIDIEFHDTEVHHPIHLSNMRGYTMAALSNKCLILACDAEDDGGSADDEISNNSSKLLCHYFGSSDVNKEWSLEMPNKEEIMAVACGEGWVSLSSNPNFYYRCFIGHLIV